MADQFDLAGLGRPQIRAIHPKFEVAVDQIPMKWQNGRFVWALDLRWYFPNAKNRLHDGSALYI